MSKMFGIDLFVLTGFFSCIFHLLSHLGLQVGQVRDDDDDEEVDHGDRAQDDHHQQEEHGKASADPVPDTGFLG